MKRLIIFTNKKSIARINEELLKIGNISLIEDNDFLALNETDSLFTIAKSIDEGSIFLVRDTISNDTLNSFLANCDRKSIGVLKHRLPDTKSNIDIATFGKCEDRGQHEAKGYFYPDVFKISMGSGPNKFERLCFAIFKTDPVAEAKRDLIAQILSGNLIEPKIVDDLKEFQGALDKFMPHKDKDIFSEVYTEAFKQLLIDLKMEEQ